MTDTATLKDWQHGHSLDSLLAIEALYADYNQHSVSPFSAVKKHTIAALLHDDELRVLRRSDGTPAAAYSVSESKVKSPITIYNNVDVATKECGDLTIAHLAGDRTRLRNALSEYDKSDTWAYVWSDDHDTQKLLTIVGFRRVCSKVSTFGEILFVYFRDHDPSTDVQSSLFELGPRQFKTQPVEEGVGIKRLGHVCSVGLLNIARVLRESGPTFTNHYSNYNKGAAWSAVSLRGFSADPAFIEKPLEMNAKWWEKHQGETFTLQDTPLRAAFPDVDALIAPYGDKFERIRFMQLAPGGGELQRHTDQVDQDTGVKIGNNARIHIPIVTNDQVEFTSWDLDNAPHVVNMRAGEVWYLDTRKPHRAINGGETSRIHLVVDVIVTPRFQDLVAGRS